MAILARPSVRSALLVVFGAVLGLLLATGALARGHDPDKFYEKGWAGASPIITVGDLQASLDGSNRADSLAAVASARNQWNSVLGAGFDFGAVVDDGSRSIAGSGCSMINNNEVLIGSYNIDKLAKHIRCATGAVIWGGRIRIDFRTWDNDGIPIASNAFDFRGVVTHELGHATGWGSGWKVHITGSSYCDTGGTWGETMCKWLDEGQSHWGDLDSHDKHTFADAT